MMHGLDKDFFKSGSSSFFEFLNSHSPELLPRSYELEVPHGTTIVALTYEGGVLLAGDRRATMGNLIASRDIEKVFAADENSIIGIAGTAGLAVELVKLFKVELEHYEKIEGVVLSLDGKANRLATLIRSNLGLAMQGLAVIPLFAGFDSNTNTGRIFSFDVTGGRYEETSFHAIGSGSIFAKGSLKKIFKPEASVEEAAKIALSALYDAADDDSATGGPDLARNIFPIIWISDSDGSRAIETSAIEGWATDLVRSRQTNPNGAQL